MRRTSLEYSAKEISQEFGSPYSVTLAMLRQLKKEGFVNKIVYSKLSFDRHPPVRWEHTGQLGEPNCAPKRSYKKEILDFIDKEHVFYTKRDIANFLNLTPSRIAWWIKVLQKEKTITVFKSISKEMKVEIDVIYKGERPCIAYSGEIKLNSSGGVLEKSGKKELDVKLWGVRKPQKIEKQDLDCGKNLSLKKRFDYALKGLAL